jgi:Fic family protein
MMTFRNHRLRDFAVPMSTNWLLNDLAEAKGKQELYTRQSPQVLKVRREMALVQNVESSNRIEGVTVAPDRLRPLVLGHARPKDRCEQEIAGYRSALNLIHTEAEELQITPDLLRRLHRLCQEGSGDAGQFKKVDNEVIELRPGGAPVIRFKCVSAKATPAAVDELCLVYRHAIDQDHIPPLVAIGALILYFLCIHPFRDGPGGADPMKTTRPKALRGGSCAGAEGLTPEVRPGGGNPDWLGRQEPAAPVSGTPRLPLRSRPRPHRHRSAISSRR